MKSTESEWLIAHNEVVALGRAGAQHEHALGRAMLRAQRAHSYVPFGMVSFYEYAEHHLGLTPRQTEDRLRVAYALERLPLMDAALAEAKLHFTAVRELVRVATPETEADWITAAKGKTVNEIEAMVSGKEPGNGPNDPSSARLTTGRSIAAR